MGIVNTFEYLGRIHPQNFKTINEYSEFMDSFCEKLKKELKSILKKTSDKKIAKLLDREELHRFNRIKIRLLGDDPDYLLNAWGEFVNDIRKGRDFTCEEFDNEISIRENILKNIKKFNKTQKIKLEKIDKKFKSLCEKNLWTNIS